MVTKFEKAMVEGHEYLETQEFEEARAAFNEALKYDKNNIDALYNFAYAASEEIGAAFLRVLTDNGLSLGGIHISWRDALHPSNHDQVLARLIKAYGKKKLLFYKLAHATARQRLAGNCIRPLRTLLAMRPHHTPARELFEKLEPLAATSALGMVASILG